MENADPKDELIAELRATVARLQRELEELRAKLGQNSRNSSKPPSSDGGAARSARLGKRPTGRRRGGQSGHSRRIRELIPAEDCTTIRDYVPTKCSGCEARLRGHDRAPQRLQWTEIPPIEPEVHECRLHALSCTRCGTVTRHAVPDELSHGHFGPRLNALVCLLTGAYRVSKRNAQRLLLDVFGLDIALGTISKLERRASVALAEPVEAVAAAIRGSPYVNIDETSWTEGHRLHWLWSASTAKLAYFRIAGSRGADISQEILGADYEGIVGSDRLGSYAWLEPRCRQVCWAHLARAFEGIIERGGDGRRFGQAMANVTAPMWRWWKSVRRGQLDHATFRRRMAPVRRKVGAMLREFASKAIKGVSRMCQNLLELEPALWTFTEHAGIDPTNNAAERALRQGVILRRTSFGTDSSTGSAFVARMLTAAETLHRQGRRAFAFLCQLFAQHRQAALLPSLVSQS